VRSPRMDGWHRARRVSTISIIHPALYLLLPAPVYGVPALMPVVHPTMACPCAGCVISLPGHDDCRASAASPAYYAPGKQAVVLRQPFVRL